MFSDAMLEKPEVKRDKLSRSFWWDLGAIITVMLGGIISVWGCV